MDNQAPPAPSEVMRRFMELIADRRKELDCSAQQLSDLCAQEQKVLISRSTIAKIETGRRSYVTLDEFLALTAVLGIDRSDFISGEYVRSPRLQPRKFVKAVYSENSPLPEVQLERIISRLSRKYQLTARESEVLALMAEGLSSYEIASRLYVANVTVSHYVSSVLQKLGVRSRRVLVKIFLAEF